MQLFRTTTGRLRVAGASAIAAVALSLTLPAAAAPKPDKQTKPVKPQPVTVEKSKKVKKVKKVKTVTFAPAKSTEAARPIATVFSILLHGDERTVVAGESVSYGFTLSRSGRVRGAVLFDVPGLPPGVTATVSPTTPSSFRIDIRTTSSAAPGSAVFAVRGRMGSIIRTAQFRLNISAPSPKLPQIVGALPPASTSQTSPTLTVRPQFTLGAIDTSRTVAPGESAQYGIAVRRVGEFTGAVELHVEGLPANTTSSFANNLAYESSVLIVTPSATTPSGSYLLSVVAQFGSTTRATAVQLIVRRTADFSLGLSPASVSMPAGNDAVTVVTVVPLPGSTSPFGPDVTFTSTGLPAGAGMLFDANPSNGVTTARVQSVSTTAVGSYQVTINGSSGLFAHAVTLTVVVQNNNVGGFGLSTTPQTASVSPAGAADFTVAISPTGGFGSNILFSVKNLPPSATATVTQQTATSATIRVATSSITPAGTFALQITGASGALSATVQVTLTVAG